MLHPPSVWGQGERCRYPNSWFCTDHIWLYYSRRERLLRHSHTPFLRLCLLQIKLLLKWTGRGCNKCYKKEYWKFHPKWVEGRIWDWTLINKRFQYPKTVANATLILRHFNISAGCAWFHNMRLVVDPLLSVAGIFLFFKSRAYSIRKLNRVIKKQ